MVYNQDYQTDQRKRLRNNATFPEKLLWQYLKDSGLGHKFRRQHGIGVYVVDFYCPRKRLAIEVDGKSHLTPEGKKHDATRAVFLDHACINVLRFTNDEVVDELDRVLEKIKQTLSEIKMETESDRA